MSLPHKNKLAAIKALLFDVDGVMTDGGVYMGEDGTSFKRFDIRDGAGIVMARRAGFMVGIISGHDSPATEARAKTLGIEICRTGVRDKVPVFEEVLEQLGIGQEETLYMGDDLMDLPLLRRTHYAVTTPDAPSALKEICDHTTVARGGRGAVRELIDDILRVDGRYDAIVRELE